MQEYKSKKIPLDERKRMTIDERFAKAWKKCAEEQPDEFEHWITEDGFEGGNLKKESSILGLGFTFDKVTQDDIDKACEILGWVYELRYSPNPRGAHRWYYHAWKSGSWRPVVDCFPQVYTGKTTAAKETFIKIVEEEFKSKGS